MSSVGSEPSERCQLMGFAGVFFQLLLVFLVIGSVFTKWYYFEEPKRPFKVFRLDVIKQALGSTFAHGLNISFSLLMQAFPVDASFNNQCVWYLINLTADTTIATLLNYMLLKALERTLRENWGIQTGYYGRVAPSTYGSPPERALSPPAGFQYQDIGRMSDGDLWKERKWSPPPGSSFRSLSEREGCIDYVEFFRQLGVWCLILLAVRVFLLVTILLFERAIYSFYDLFMEPLMRFPNVQMFLTLVFVPLLLNIFQFTVQDAFLKFSSRKEGEAQEGRSMGA